MKRVVLIVGLLSLMTFMQGTMGVARAFTLKVATIAPEGTSLTNALRAASKEIEKKTDGKVKLKIYPGGVMGTDAVVLRKIRLGQLHGGTFTSGGVSGLNKNFQILGMPLLLTNYKEVDVARRDYEARIVEPFVKAGYFSTGILESGFVYMMSNKPIAKPADLKGQKVWVPEDDPISRAVFEKAGIHPIPLPIPDVLTGLQTNLIDTISCPPVAAIVLQWFTKVKDLSETPLLYSYGTFLVSEKALKRVPEKDRQTVRDILKEQMKKVDAANRKDNQAALQTLKKQGIQFVPVVGQDLVEMRRIADEAMEELRTKNLFDYKIYEQVKETISAMRQ